MHTSFFFLAICISTLLYVPAAQASTLFLQSNDTSLHVGDVFYIDVLLTTEGETINALDVAVKFPPDILSFVKAEDTNSVVSLWVTKPKETNSSQIELGGITPGGTKGEELHVVRLHFKVQKEGQGIVEFTQSQILLHDGKGTESDVRTRNIHVAVTAGESTYNERLYTDTEPPEVFTVERMHDPDVFDGQMFLVFETQDKNSGILKYQVREGFFGRYTDAVSPYKLRHQDDDRNVSIKAIDRAGNETVIQLYPQSGYTWFLQQERIFSILIVFISLCLFFFMYRLRRVKK